MGDHTATDAMHISSPYSSSSERNMTKSEPTKLVANSQQELRIAISAWRERASQLEGLWPDDKYNYALITEQCDLLRKDMKNITRAYEDLELILPYSEAEYELMRYETVEAEHYRIISDMLKRTFKWKSLRCDSDNISQCSYNSRSSRSSGSSRACDKVPKFNVAKVDSDFEMSQTILGLEKAEVKLHAITPMKGADIAQPLRAKETEAEPIVSPVPRKRTDKKRDTADETSEEDAKRDTCGMASTCTSAMTDLNQELANPEHEPCKRISQEICDKPAKRVKPLRLRSLTPPHRARLKMPISKEKLFCIYEDRELLVPQRADMQENCIKALPENGKLPKFAAVPQRADIQQNCDGVLPRHGMQPDFEAAVHEALKPAMKPVLRGADLQKNCDDALPENGKLPNFAAVPQRADIQQECDGVLPQHGKAPDFKAAVHKAPKPAGNCVPRGADLQDHCDDTLQENCDEELPENGKLPYLATVPQRADLQQECEGELPRHGKQPNFKDAVHEAPKPAVKPVMRKAPNLALVENFGRAPIAPPIRTEPMVLSAAPIVPKRRLRGAVRKVKRRQYDKAYKDLKGKFKDYAKYCAIRDVPAKEPLHARGPTLKQSLDTVRGRPPRKKMCGR